MVTVLNVRESLDCNWKVVVDAFQEGYHIQAIHPELLQIVVIDPTTNRFRFWGDHEVACAPFAVTDATPEDEYEGLKSLPDTFPTRHRIPPALRGAGRRPSRQPTATIEYPPASPAGRCCSRPPARPSPKWGSTSPGSPTPR